MVSEDEGRDCLGVMIDLYLQEIEGNDGYSADKKLTTALHGLRRARESAFHRGEEKDGGYIGSCISGIKFAWRLGAGRLEKVLDTAEKRESVAGVNIIRIKDADFNDVEIDVKELPSYLERSVYVRQRDLPGITGIKYQTLVSRMTHLKTMKRRRVGTLYSPEIWCYLDAEMYAKLTCGLREQKKQEKEEKAEEEKQEDEIGEDGVIIKDSKFNDLEIKALDVSNLPLDEGCWLSITQIQGLTGFSEPWVYQRIKGIEKRSLGYRKGVLFYFNRKSYEEMFGNKRDEIRERERKRAKSAEPEEEKEEKEDIPKFVHLDDILAQARIEGRARPSNLDVFRVCEELGIDVDYKKENPEFRREDAKRLVEKLRS